MFKRHLETDTGIIRVKAAGIWTIAEVDAHFEALRAMIDECRAAGQPVRVLIDIRDAARQPAAVESRFDAHKDGTYLPGDRVAILTGGPEARDHVRTLLNGGEIWSWSSEIAAEQWLLLDGKHAGGDRRG